MFASGKNFFAWGILVLIAILIIVAGIQGSAGKMLAVVLVPSELDVVTGNVKTNLNTGGPGGLDLPGMGFDPMTGRYGPLPHYPIGAA